MKNKITDGVGVSKLTLCLVREMSSGLSLDAALKKVGPANMQPADVRAAEQAAQEQLDRRSDAVSDEMLSDLDDWMG